MVWKKARLKRFREFMSERRLDGFLVTGASNVRYLSGFTGDDSALLISRRGAYLVTDFRYLEQAKHELDGVGIVPRKRSLAGAIVRKICALRLKRVGFEAANLKYQSYQDLRRLLKGRARLAPMPDWGMRLRQVKDSDEIAAMREAIRQAEAAFGHVCRMIRPGVTELDMANELEYQMRKLGAQCSAFSIITAAGRRSALPHASATRQRLKSRGMVLFDWGARYEMYNCDLTRVVFMDKIPARLRKVYQIVREAQQRALDAIRPGVPACEIDSAAREHIKAHGFGDKFGHGLGHGVGLDVHERPTISSACRDVVEEGMIFTVEPGIYLPDVGGIRIEDMVRVTSGGCEVLTNFPRGIDDALIVTS